MHHLINVASHTHASRRFGTVPFFLSNVQKLPLGIGSKTLSILFSTKVHSYCPTLHVMRDLPKTNVYHGFIYLFIFSRGTQN